MRQVTRREGKVYVDYLQNGSGKLIVAPFSVRPLPGAPVSVPLAWREVNRKLDIRKHTIKTVPERMRKLKTDPLAEVLELSPDLGAALERLMGELRVNRWMTSAIDVGDGPAPSPASCSARPTPGCSTSWRTAPAPACGTVSWKPSRDALAARGIATLRYQFPYVEAGGRPPRSARGARGHRARRGGRRAGAAPDLPLVAGGSRSAGG